jgi:hypothetical protein
MELVRALSGTDHPIRAELHQHSRGGSKWSYSYVKELLLSAPRAPTTIPASPTETTASTELTVISASPQAPLTSTAAPKNPDAIGTAATIASEEAEYASTTINAPTGIIDTYSSIPAISTEAETVPTFPSPLRDFETRDVSGQSTAAGHPVNEAASVFKLQKDLYVSPNMKTDSKSQEIWAQHIKERLNAELWHALRTERCLQEFLMIGSRPDCLRASVVITCCGEPAAKKVRKVVKRLKWLRDLDVPCAVVVDKIHLYSQGRQLQTGELTARIEAEVPPHPKTLCGVHIRPCSWQNNRRPLCTLGGLILLGGVPFGLTAGHAFIPGFEISEFQSPNKDDICSSLDAPYDDRESSQSPFVSFDDDGDSDTFHDSAHSLPEPTQLSDPATPVLESVDQTAGSNQTSDLQDMVFRRIGDAMPWTRRPGLALQARTDWTLIRVDDPSCFLLNQMKLQGQDASTVVEDFVLEDFENEGPVIVLLARDRTRKGWLLPSPALLKVGNLVMDTRLIVLEENLGELPCGASKENIWANGVPSHRLW